MALQIFIQILVIAFLLWIVKKLVVFYKGILSEKENKSSLFSLMKITVPLAIAGLGVQVGFIVFLLLRTVGG